MSVDVNQLTRSFDRVEALRQVDFQVQDGELFGLIGPDGAGKSTLLRIIVSLLRPDSGSCTVNGNDVVADYRKVRRSIGYMPGRFSLYLDLSVEENLAFYAGVFGTTIQENYDLIRDVYKQIEPFRKRLAGRLSGGMKQKLALSCALIHRPEVLILDEPTTGVDAVSRREFWDMLKKIKGEGITILVSTPYMDEAEQCDRVALIQKGRILDISDPSLLAEDAHPVYALRSPGGVYRYLEWARNQAGCLSAWLFGDELHITLQSPGDERNMRSALEKKAGEDFDLIPVRASIEDRFMGLIREEMENDQP